MKANAEMSSMYISLPKEKHKRIKMLAIARGQTLRELVIDALDNLENESCGFSHIPNEETLQSIKNIEEGKNLHKVDSLEELFKRAGIK